MIVARVALGDSHYANTMFSENIRRPPERKKGTGHHRQSRIGSKVQQTLKDAQCPPLGD
jgi:hypothetical protein